MHHVFFDNGVSSSNYFGLGMGLVFGGFILILALWSLVWKALALWKAARLGSKWWFVILLVVNTFGILEILYIYIFSKKNGLHDIMRPAKPVASTLEDEADATVV